MKQPKNPIPETEVSKLRIAAVNYIGSNFNIHIRLNDIDSKYRGKEIVFHRSLICCYLKYIVSLSVLQVAQVIGKDHCSVLWMLKYDEHNTKHDDYVSQFAKAKQKMKSDQLSPLARIAKMEQDLVYHTNEAYNIKTKLELLKSSL